MYLSKSEYHYTDRVYPHLGLDDLQSETIKTARIRAVNRTHNHLWAKLSDEELLRRSGLILKDPYTSEEGITLAGILLFGTDTAIASVLPHHKTDALVRVFDKDRYDDREVITCNLLDSYEQLIDFGKKHLKDIFVLEDVFSVSARDAILREIVANTLAHRDYSSSYRSTMTIDEHQITIKNANITEQFGPLDPNYFTPLSKNPSIAKIFREIGYADELGSGMHNTYKYTSMYSGTSPTFDDGDVFTTIIPLPTVATMKIGPNVAYDMEDKLDTKSNRISQRRTAIYQAIVQDPHVTRKDLAAMLNVSIKTIERDLELLRQARHIEYVGGAKEGHWQVSRDSTMARHFL